VENRPQTRRCDRVPRHRRHGVPHRAARTHGKQGQVLDRVSGGARSFATELIGQESTMPDARTLFVGWQDPDRRRWYPVARVTLEAAQYTFEYLEGARQASEDAGFSGVAQFPDRYLRYSSKELFAFLRNRVLSPSRPDFEDHVRRLALELPADGPVPFDLLSRSGGRGRPTASSCSQVRRSQPGKRRSSSSPAGCANSRTGRVRSGRPERRSAPCAFCSSRGTRRTRTPSC
jgi:hypothetical protein